MSTTVKIIADSVSLSGKRITTFELVYPRIILAEFNTHRMFSRSTQSNRAVPFNKLVEDIKNDPYIPSYWGINQSGMSTDKQFPECDIEYLKEEWLRARNEVVYYATRMADTGLHKQTVNRLLETFQYVYTIVTATEWDNWYALRTDKNAHPDIQLLANKMLDAHNTNIPRLLNENEWHLPYITEEEKAGYDLEDCLKCSVARCARVSYKNHDKSNPDIKKDIELHDKLLENKHMSAFEHQAKPMKKILFDNTKAIYDESGITHTDKNGKLWSGNFQGWLQLRQMLKDSVYIKFEGLK
jgi:thymidylate synthase ThyX